MSVSHGADVDALRAASRTLADAAHVLFTVNVRLSARAYDFTWNGPDATRFRAQWEGEYAPQVDAVTRALNQAATDIAEQAADQERASGADGVPSQATVGLLARLKAQRDVLGMFTDAYQTAQVVGALSLPEAWQSLAEFDRAWRASDAFASPLAKATGNVLGTLGTALSAYDLSRGVVEGDVSAVVENGVPLGTAALVARHAISGGAGAAVSVSWSAGMWAGGKIYEGMQGTSYGDRVSENFDAVFDRLGVGGVILSPIVTPVVLAKSGLDMLLDDDGAPPIP